MHRLAASNIGAQVLEAFPLDLLLRRRFLIPTKVLCDSPHNPWEEGVILGADIFMLLRGLLIFPDAQFSNIVLHFKKTRNQPTKNGAPLLLLARIGMIHASCDCSNQPLANPVVLEKGLSIRPGRRDLAQTLLDKVHSSLTHIQRIRGYLTPQDKAGGEVDVLCLKRCLPGQKLVYKDANLPDIDLLVVGNKPLFPFARFPLLFGRHHKHFRRHVVH
mmetsp:Transcript_3167/g.8978  ORF Transcript_3167/g.8978 Transcript_3167/m.8978 type:complete len:217 (+) Transcript_3167:316-966(+)